MPRTLLARESVDAELIKKEIEKRLTDIGKNKSWLSIQADIEERTLRNRMKKGSWKFEELYSIFRVTQMPQETILKICGR